MPFTLRFLKTQWRAFTAAHPLIKGSISYAILWPTSSLIEQTFDGKNIGA